MNAQEPIILTDIVELDEDRQTDVEPEPNACAGCRFEERCHLFREPPCDLWEEPIVLTNVVVAGDLGALAVRVRF